MDFKAFAIESARAEFAHVHTKIATVRGYTNQARFNAARLDIGDGNWKQLGWTALPNGAVKPVFETLDGLPCICLDGKDHLTVNWYQVHPGDIRETEEECYRKAVR